MRYIVRLFPQSGPRFASLPAPATSKSNEQLNCKELTPCQFFIFIHSYVRPDKHQKRPCDVIPCLFMDLKWTSSLRRQFFTRKNINCLSLFKKKVVSPYQRNITILCLSQTVCNHVLRDHTLRHLSFDQRRSSICHKYPDRLFCRDESAQDLHLLWPKYRNWLNLLSFIVFFFLNIKAQKDNHRDRRTYRKKGKYKHES